MAKKKKKESSASTLFLVALLMAVIIGGMYYNRKQPGMQKIFGNFSPSNETATIPVAEFLAGKQEITDAFGGVPQITGDPDLSWQPGDTQKRLNLTLQGEKAAGTLSLTVSRPQGQWRFDALEFTIAQHKQAVSSLYATAAVFHAASLSSAPLKEGVFAEDEDIFISLNLAGIQAGQAKYQITQGLKIFDQDNQLIASQDNIARFDSTTYQEKIPFTDKIGHLPPGTYYLQLNFLDTNTKQAETVWQEIRVKKLPVAIPLVRRVTYATDSGFKNIRREPLFTAGENINIKMELGGFKVSDGKIAGTVGLTVINSAGKTAAKNPKFAAFTKPYDPNATLTITGSLKITDPDVYLLTFTLEDFFTKTVITHDEKLVVRLPKK
jgi:hypothetical protein